MYCMKVVLNLIITVAHTPCCHTASRAAVPLATLDVSDKCRFTTYICRQSRVHYQEPNPDHFLWKTPTLSLNVKVLDFFHRENCPLQTIEESNPGSPLIGIARNPLDHSVWYVLYEGGFKLNHYRRAHAVLPRSPTCCGSPCDFGRKRKMQVNY